MYVYLFALSLAGICVTLGGLGLYFEIKKRIEELEASLKTFDTELTEHKRDIGSIKKDNTKKPEFIYIVTDENPSDDIKYGGF